MEAGDVDGARARFKQGLAVDAHHIHLWQAWGVLEFRQGDLERARQLFQEGVWADPGNKDVVVVFQVRGGGTKSYIAIAESAIKRKRGNMQLYVVMHAEDNPYSVPPRCTL